jgi:polar amino acid transport system substrate-binding protein
MNNAWRWLRVTSLVFVFLLAGGRFPVFGADTLQVIRSRGVLLWGADAEGGAPYVYPDPQKPDQLIDFEYELGTRFGSAGPR